MISNFVSLKRKLETNKKLEMLLWREMKTHNLEKRNIIQSRFKTETIINSAQV